MGSVEDRLDRLEKMAGLKDLPKKTHLVFVLDESGSMKSRIEETIGTFNTQVKQFKENQDELGETTATLVTFGVPGNIEGMPLVKENFLGRPVSRLPRLVARDYSRDYKKNPLSEDEALYEPNGMTPLRDGVGYAVEKAIKELDDQGKDTAFLLIVITDGYENASSRFSGQALQSLIKDIKANPRWTVQVLGCDIELSVATSMGFQQEDVAMYGGSRRAAQAMASNLISSNEGYIQMRSAGQTRSATGNLGTQDAPDEAGDDISDTIGATEPTSSKTDDADKS